jgi:hypothetical protein
MAQDALHIRQVGLSRVVHVQADLLHDISDVGPCECQVLEGFDNAPELRKIGDRRGNGRGLTHEDGRRRGGGRGLVGGVPQQGRGTVTSGVL